MPWVSRITMSCIGFEKGWFFLESLDSNIREEYGYPSLDRTIKEHVSYIINLFFEKKFSDYTSSNPTWNDNTYKIKRWQQSCWVFKIPKTHKGTW